MALVGWLRGSIGRVNLEVLRDHARASVLDVNDGITSAAGIAEGFISAGASTRTLLLAGTAVILAGGSAAAGARFSEVRTEWEMDRARLEAERASIEADPAGEFEELVGIYEAKGLNPRLARQVAEALTERDPVAAHADAELRLEALGPTSGAVPAGFDRGPLLRRRRRHSARSDDMAAAGRAAGPDLHRHRLRPRADGLVRGMADRAAGDQAGTPQYRAREAVMVAGILVGLVLD